MAKLVSKAYGDALFALALDEQKIDLLFEEVKLFLEMLQKGTEAERYVHSKEFEGFLLLLIQKNRFSEIEKILEYFIELVKEYKKIGVVYISAATVLNDVQKKNVEKRLLETTDYETFEMNYTVDESLLGGMVIRLGDRILDTSIKRKLKNLSKQLSQSPLLSDMQT